MQRISVGVRIDRNGLNTHTPCAFDDPAGDFATIGDQDALEHARLFFPPRAGFSELCGAAAKSQ
jgi:hypothetical protein